MLKFILSTESACDLTIEQANKYNISISPMTYYINGEEYNSATSGLTIKDVCDKMRAGLTTKTTQLNEAEIEEYLGKLLTHGKDILHISFSGAMSGTCNNFKRIAEKLNETNSNKIYVVDSLCQSGGLGLFLSMISIKAENENLTAEEAFIYAEATKQSIGHYFIVDDLKYLARGGRISNSAAIIGNIIKLKPVLHVDNTGTITQLQKVLGRKKSIASLIENFKKYYNNENKMVYITQADCLDEANELKSKLEEINPNIDVTINDLGPIICSHSGPGTIALFFSSYKR